MIDKCFAVGEVAVHGGAADPCSSCSGLHRDVLDAIDAVAEAWLNEPASLVANARKVFENCAGAPQ